MDDFPQDPVRKNNSLSPLITSGESRTYISCTTLNSADKTVSSFDYTQFSRSENNIKASSSLTELQDVNLTKLLQAMTLKQQTSLPNSPNIETELAHHQNEDLGVLRNDSFGRHDIQNLHQKYSEVLKIFVAKMEAMNNHEKIINLDYVYMVMQHAWAIPTYGHKLGYSLCKYLRLSGGLGMLIKSCIQSDKNVQFSSARLLEQCLTRENTKHIVENGLEKVLKLAVNFAKNTDTKYSRVGTGIIEHLLKQNERTCFDVIRLGGLDAVLFECRINDLETLRNCARALANLSLYGGAENQEAMIIKKVPMWLFPLAFNDDDNIKYFACLAIAVLLANKEIESEVLKSGTLDLVERFVTSQDPSKFANSNLANIHGQGKDWLKRLVPVLSSNREEAIYLAAFHFCMEAGIKKEQGYTEIFREIGAIDPLKAVASCPNAIASKFAAQTLRLIGETVPHKLSQQVPLWSIEDVKEWVKRIDFGAFERGFVESQVDGDMLLKLNEQNLKDDIGISNGILRMRFLRELQNLKKIADYSSKNCAKIHQFLNEIGPDYCVYTYDMLNAGIGKFPLELLNENMLLTECGIHNSIHREKILNAADSLKNSLTNELEANMDKPLDVFVSYRRSSGSQLASLLKVHLQLKNFTVFIDVERLEAGKFDNGLLNSIREAKHFILVLTANALDRCVEDSDGKDWVHREIVAALESNCNIIPILDNFSWPDTESLPEDMRSICHFNAVTWIHDYQDACIDKLERFMRGESKTDLLTFEKTKTIYSDYDSDSFKKNKTKKASYPKKLKKKPIRLDLRSMSFAGHSIDDIDVYSSNSELKSSVSSLKIMSESFSVDSLATIQNETYSSDKVFEFSDKNDDVKQNYKYQNVNQMVKAASMHNLAGHEDMGPKNESSNNSQSDTAEHKESNENNVSKNMSKLSNARRSAYEKFRSFLKK